MQRPRAKPPAPAADGAREGRDGEAVEPVGHRVRWEGGGSGGGVVAGGVPTSKRGEGESEGREGEGEGREGEGEDGVGEGGRVESERGAGAVGGNVPEAQRDREMGGGGRDAGTAERGSMRAACAEDVNAEGEALDDGDGAGGLGGIRRRGVHAGEMV